MDVIRQSHDYVFSIWSRFLGAIAPQFLLDESPRENVDAVELARWADDGGPVKGGASNDERRRGAA